MQDAISSLIHQNLLGSPSVFAPSWRISLFSNSLECCKNKLTGSHSSLLGRALWVQSCRQVAHWSPVCMETSFLFLDFLAVIIPVKKTCDSLIAGPRQPYLQWDRCILEIWFYFIFPTLGKKYFEARQIPWLHWSQRNAREWKILLSQSSTCSLWDVKFSVSLFKNVVGGQSRFFFSVFYLFCELRCLFGTMN